LVVCEFEFNVKINTEIVSHHITKEKNSSHILKHMFETLA